MKIRIRLFIIACLFTFTHESKAMSFVKNNVPCTLYNIETKTRSPRVIFDCGDYGFKIAYGHNALKFAKRGQNYLTYLTNSAWVEDNVIHLNGHKIHD